MLFLCLLQLDKEISRKGSPSTSPIQIDMHLVVHTALEMPVLASLASNPSFSFLTIRIKFLNLSIFKTNSSRHSLSWPLHFSDSQVLCYRDFFPGKAQKTMGWTGLSSKSLEVLSFSSYAQSSASDWPFLSLIILSLETDSRSNWVPRPLGKLEHSRLSICPRGDVDLLAISLVTGKARA